MPLSTERVCAAEFLPSPDVFAAPVSFVNLKQSDGVSDVSIISLYFPESGLVNAARILNYKGITVMLRTSDIESVVSCLGDLTVLCSSIICTNWLISG